MYDAVDALQEFAEASGLVCGVGYDVVQQVLSEAFAAALGDAADTAAAADAETGAEIVRLANLNPVQYEHERKDAAERLRLRASVLDRLVSAERPVNEGMQGRALSLPEPEPWPQPVDGGELL